MTLIGNTIKSSLTVFILVFTVLNGYAQLTPEEVHDKIAGSVVVINLVDSEGNWMNQGSGVFVDSLGTLWTNFHLFEKDCSFEISNEFRSFDSCKIIGANPDKDILILKVSGKIDNFIRPDTLRDRKKGAIVYAYGNPESKLFTFSDGIISNFSEVLYNDQTYIQYTASISHGSSGGALVNEFGEIIGITNSTFAKDNSQNLNYAVTSEDFLNTPIFLDTPESHLYTYCVAHQFEIEGRLTQALHLFQEYNEHYPDDSHSYYKSGMCCLRLGRYKEAVEFFDKAILLNDNRAYYRDRGYARMLDSNYVGARTDLEYALRLNSVDGYLFTYLAMLESNYLGNYKKALELCNLAIRSDSYDPFFYRTKGSVYLNMKDTNLALSSYIDAIYVDSLDTKALYFVADLSSKLRNFRDAITVYSTILRIDQYAESDPDIFYNRGIAYRNVNKIQKAIEDLKESLNLDERNVNCLNALGYCYLETGEFEVGYKFFKKAVKENKVNWESYVGLAIASNYLKEYDESTDFFLKAVKLFPKLKKGMAEIPNINRWRLLNWNSDELSILEKLCNENELSDFYHGNRKDTKASIPLK